MKRIISTTILSMLIAGQISAMQPAAARTASQLFKHFAKKTFSGTMTGLHWGIAGSLPMGLGMTQAYVLLNEGKVFQALSNANEETADFISSELQKKDIILDGVKICPTFNRLSIPMATLPKHIIMSCSTADEITQALENNDETILNKWSGVLDHESSHIANNDMVWRSAAGLTLPFVTHG